jgi:hypothetical protein
VGQVTIYLDDETADKAKAAAQSQGISLSKWIAGRIRHGTLSDWPTHVRELAGAWSDLPSAEELRKLRHADAKRAKL